MGKHHRTAREWPQAYSHFHLIEPLPASPVLDSPEMEEALVAEALRRGAGDLFSLLRILRQWRAYRRRNPPRPTSSLLNARILFEPDFGGQADAYLTERCSDAYYSQVQQEFSGLRDDVSGSFAFEKNEPLAYYSQLRPADRKSVV